MAKERKFSKSQDLQTRYDLNQQRSTSPKHHICLPLTPPATDERGGRALDVSAVDGVLRVLDATRNRTAAGQIAPWTQVNITKQQYDQLLEKLERDLRRFDFEPSTGLLTVRMPSPVHDFFSTLLADDVHDWLKGIAASGGESGAFASKIASGGSSRILLGEGDLEGPSDPVRRQPDAQFQHQDTAYPGVVVEVSYSQDGKNLQKLAQDYILYSNGDIKAVIGIDINYGGKESTVSVWRPEYSRKGNKEFEYLETRQDIANKPFRSVNGSAINHGEYLHIMLSDFATDEISTGHESVSLSISFERLSNLLTRAEQIQQAREPTDGRGRIKSKRQTKKRRLSSSPVDELMSEDEASFLGQETKAAQRAEAADEDFEEPAAKRRGLSTRR